MKANPELEAALFEAAIQRTGPDRRAFLDRACHDHPTLRARLDALLAAHEGPEDALATAAPPAGGTLKIEFADLPDETVGMTLGRYKLREKVGEGGCGVVYVAEQTEPVRRRVALKVIKLGMDTREVIARFEAERQALAMMDHPNIAKVLDAGTTGAPVAQASPPASSTVVPAVVRSGGGTPPKPAGGDACATLSAGRPYFVMELVRGIRITDYCDQANLSTKERLDLFIKVCQAIQHAHQKGIIHRDIKPSNILVTLHDGVPVPKVIDFGIAKATEGRLTDNTVYTQLHQFIGTPAYMSPEQAEMSGLDIDTRSDIYSLGVLLYELLAGSTPFDPKELMAQGIDAMRKTIREKEPVRPSTKLATLQGEELTTTTKRRSADTSKLLHQLKGDLDWIVMKCLEKDRTRRYETANGLAADIKRHLANEPVTARPPSTLYRFQKAWRRNKVAYTAGLAVALALVVGLIASVFALVGQNRARKAEEEASLSRARANSTAAVVAGMVTEAVPRLLELDNRTAVSVVLDSAETLVSEKLSDSPMAEFTVRQAIRDQHLSGGLFQLKDAITQIVRLEQLEPMLTEAELPASERLVFRIQAAGMHAIFDQFEDGTSRLRDFRRQLESMEPRPTGLIVETLIMENDANVIEGRMEEAERLVREACKIGAEMPGRYNLTQEGPWARLTNVLLYQGKYEDAIEPAQKALDLVAASGRPSGISEFADRVIDALCGSRRFAEAEAMIRKLEENAKPWGAPRQSDLDALKVQWHLAQDHWTEAEDILIRNGLKPGAESRDWRLGALAAAVRGDSAVFSQFVQKGYGLLAVADNQSAYWLLEILSLHPQPKEVNKVIEGILQRLETASVGWWTSMITLAKARRSLHKGDYQEALNFINQYVGDNKLQGVAKLVHRQILREQRQEYSRAVALAGLGKTEEAKAAFNKAWDRKKAGPPIGGGARTIVGKYLSERFSRHWAAGEFTKRGIELPREAIDQ